MSADIEGVREAARSWAIRLHDPAFAQWDAFTDWLERDPRHLAAYHAALDDDATMAGLFASAPRRIEPAARPPARRLGWRIGGSALAAGIAAVAAWTLWSPAAGPREIATRLGEQRTVQLADGSSIVLNGGTRLTLDGGNPRRATLLAGEALFRVRHDAARPFTVDSGGVRLLDAGTVFNVVRDGGELRVAVAEGAVIYQPGARQIRLDPGKALAVADAHPQPQISEISVPQVGGWRTGQLVYSDARLDRVARDLSRNLGAQVVARGGSEKLRFTGILTIEGEPAVVLPRIAPLMGVRMMKTTDGWTMLPIRGARR